VHHVDTPRPSADFIKENNNLQVVLKPFGKSPWPVLCSNGNEAFDCWSADFFVLDAFFAPEDLPSAVVTREHVGRDGLTGAEPVHCGGWGDLVRGDVPPTSTPEVFLCLKRPALRLSIASAQPLQLRRLTLGLRSFLL